MNASEALPIVEALCGGFDPQSGEPLATDAPYQQPQVLRALFKAMSVLEAEEVRERRRARLPEMAGKPWSDDEENLLASSFDAGDSIAVLAIAHRRTRASIKARLIKLGRLEAPS